MKSAKKRYEQFDLRRGVDFIGITCVFFCHDGKGRLLLSKRSKKCRDEIGCWDPGGGALEFGEEFEEGVRREVKEEYCCDIEELKFLGAHNVLRKNGNVDTHWVALIFTAKIDPKQVKNGDPEKIDELGWFKLDSLPDPLHSQMPRFIGLLGDVFN